MKTPKDAPPDVHFIPARCPECGDMHDVQGSSTPGDTRLPSPGDFTICINCGEVMVFDDALRPRRSTLKERGELPDEVFGAIDFIAKRGRLRP